MWHFCLVVDLLHLCAERGFDTSWGSYMLLKWPLGQARDKKKNLRPRLPSCYISTALISGQSLQGVSHGSGMGDGPPGKPKSWFTDPARHSLVCVWVGHGSSLSLDFPIYEMERLSPIPNDPEFGGRGLMPKTTLGGRALVVKPVSSSSRNHQSLDTVSV